MNAELEDTQINSALDIIHKYEIETLTEELKKAENTIEIAKILKSLYYVSNNQLNNQFDNQFELDARVEAVSIYESMYAVLCKLNIDIVAFITAYLKEIINKIKREKITEAYALCIILMILKKEEKNEREGE